MHDASRLEWVASVPLPTNKKKQEFVLSFELEVPAHLFVAHDHWRDLQMLSRLESPLEEPGARQNVVVSNPDELRELALSVAHRVKVLRQNFVRECFMANSMLAPPPSERRSQILLDGFTSVESEVADARLALSRFEAASLKKERLLADEFLSNQVLDFLTHARRAVDEQLLRPGGPHTEAFRALAAEFERRLESALVHEMKMRNAAGYLTPASSDAPSLEHYLERSSLLKKHFQELLFLRHEQVLVDSQVKHWGGVVGAMLASIFAFGFNKGLWNAHAMEAGLGLSMVGLIGAVVYAIQDRIKDFGKNYFTAKVGHFYAQRVTSLFSPARLSSDAERRLGAVRESLSTKSAAKPDPLNPDPTMRRVVTLRYHARGQLRPDQVAQSHHMHAVKQIFRYDLSWLFARLDDAVKQVPVVQGGAVSLASAPRCYRLPVRVCLSTADGVYEDTCIAVVHKRGLERCDPAPAEIVAPVALEVA